MTYYWRKFSCAEKQKSHQNHLLAEESFGFMQSFQFSIRKAGSGCILYFGFL